MSTRIASGSRIAERASPPLHFAHVSHPTRRRKEGVVRTLGVRSKGVNLVGLVSSTPRVRVLSENSSRLTPKRGPRSRARTPKDARLSWSESELVGVSRGPKAAVNRMVAGSSPARGVRKTRGWPMRLTLFPSSVRKLSEFSSPWGLSEGQRRSSASALQRGGSRRGGRLPADQRSR
jgi:hypothetical protein